MKIIFKIAKAELRNLFYSPIAWIVIVVFFVITGIEFVTPLMEKARQQQVFTENSPGWGGFMGPLTFLLFEDTIQQILSYFYFFIPLLTMGTISREVNTGSMYLLSSSPVRIREIVAGKYLGLLMLNLALLSSVALLLLTGYFSIVQAELKWYMSMMLGFFLLSSAYMAIGVFVSSLTNYQVLAGIATFIIFFLLSVAGMIWQRYDFIRDLTYFLSISGRAEKMITGLITTRDVLYFILIILLFLGLTVIRLKKKQESKRWTVSFSRSMIWTIVILMLGYLSSRPGYIGYLDVTRDKRNTIDSATQAVLKELDGSPLTVTLYTNLLGGFLEYGLPEARNNYIWGFWDQYVRFYPNIKWKYEYYYDIQKGDSSFHKRYPKKNIHQIAEQVARLNRTDTAMFKKPEEIRKMVDLSREKLRLIMELEYKGKKTFLRTFDMVLWPKQWNMSASIGALVRDSIPSVTFLTGHYERSPWRNGEREYGSHTNYTPAFKTLINLGFRIDTVSLLNKEIPDSTDVLVVADPRSKLEDIEQEKIIRYLNNGGNALFYAEPGKQQMLNPVLNQLGVNIDDGVLVNPEKHKASDAVLASMTRAGNFMAKEDVMQLHQYFGKASASAGFFGSSTISFKEKDGFKTEPIIKVLGNKKTWIERGVFVSDSAAPLFAPDEGDLRKDEYVVGVKLNRRINNKDQRIVVTGDAEFMSKYGGNGNAIGNGLYSWLVNNEYPVYTKYVLPADIKLTIGKNAGNIIWYTYVYIIPGLLLLAGAIIIIRRKRK